MYRGFRTKIVRYDHQECINATVERQAPVIPQSIAHGAGTNSGGMSMRVVIWRNPKERNVQETNEQQAVVPSWKVGRLLDPNSSLGTDPRVDSRIAGILRKVGGADLPGELPFTPASPREELLGFAQAVEDGTNGMIAAVLEGHPATASASEILTARGRDGNEITLYVHRPSGKGKAPCRPSFTCTAAEWSRCPPPPPSSTTGATVWLLPA